MNSDEKLNVLLEAAENAAAKEPSQPLRNPGYPVYNPESPLCGNTPSLGSLSRWSSSDDTIFRATSSTRKQLTPGVYEICEDNLGTYFEKIPVKTEHLIKFPDSKSELVVNEIMRFWEKESHYHYYNLSYKRGILLWGPPGSGKSATIQIISRDVISREGIVIKFNHPRLFIDGMRQLREIQPETPLVVLMEDIDSTLEEYSETSVLNILDGINNVHKTVFLATTNYPEKLGARIVNRPSRFDKRFEIDFLNTESRRVYFNSLFKKESNQGINLDQWVEDTENLSIAHLKELFIAVVINEELYDNAITTVKSMKGELRGGGRIGLRT